MNYKLRQRKKVINEKLTRTSEKFKSTKIYNMILNFFFEGNVILNVKILDIWTKYILI